MLPTNKPNQHDLNPLASQTWYDKPINIPGIGYIRNAWLKINEVLHKRFWTVFFIVGFACVCRNESGWKTIVIKDVARPQTFKLHSVLSFLPVGQYVYAVGNLEGRFLLQQGTFPSDRTYSETVEAKGHFICHLRSGDWYGKSYVHYTPIQIKKDEYGQSGEIRIHYKYVDFWDVLMLDFDKAY